MTALRRPRLDLTDSEATHEEIAHLASFGMSPERIALDLGLALDTVMAYASGRRGRRPIRMNIEQVPDLPVPAHGINQPRRKK